MFPSPPIDAVDCTLHVGPSMEQLLEETETALRVEASKTHILKIENAGLLTKVGILKKEVGILSKERYTLIYEKRTLENRLGDFNSCQESRIEYEQLKTEFMVMKTQRAREHILQERNLQMAKETQIQLAAAKQAKAKSKIAHSHELEQVRRERDELKQQHQILLAATPAVIITSAVAAAVATTTVAKGKSPGVTALQEDNNRLNLALAPKHSYSQNNRLKSTGSNPF